MGSLHTATFLCKCAGCTSCQQAAPAPAGIETVCAPRLGALTPLCANWQQQNSVQLLSCAGAVTDWAAFEALLAAAPGSTALAGVQAQAGQLVPGTTALAGVQAQSGPAGTWNDCPGRSAGAKRASWYLERLPWQECRRKAGQLVPGSTALAGVQAQNRPGGTWKYCPGRSAGAKRARWTTMPRELPLSDSAPPRMGCCTMRPRAISSCACVWTVRDSGTTQNPGSAETAETAV